MAVFESASKLHERRQCAERARTEGVEKPAGWCARARWRRAQLVQQNIKATRCMLAVSRTQRIINPKRRKGAGLWWARAALHLSL